MVSSWVRPVEQGILYAAGSCCHTCCCMCDESFFFIVEKCYAAGKKEGNCKNCEEHSHASNRATSESAQSWVASTRGTWHQLTADLYLWPLTGLPGNCRWPALQLQPPGPGQVVSCKMWWRDVPTGNRPPLFLTLVVYFGTYIFFVSDSHMRPGSSVQFANTCSCISSHTLVAFQIFYRSPIRKGAHRR